MPFHTVALHGLVRDQYGKKMSKSKGNTVDPLQWIEDYGADAVRFTLARGSNPGADQAIAVEWVAGSGKFLLEAVQRHQVRAAERREGADRAARRAGADPGRSLDPGPAGRGDHRRPPTCWAISSSARRPRGSTTSPGTRSSTGTWSWPRCRLPKAGGDPQRVATTQQVLGTVLDSLFRLLHPFVPFVTETLWTSLTGGESLVIARLADAVRPGRRIAAAARWLANIDELATQIRRFRADQGLPPSQRVPASVDDRAGRTRRWRLRCGRSAGSAGAGRRLQLHETASIARRRWPAAGTVDGRSGHLVDDRRRCRDRPRRKGSRAGRRRSSTDTAKRLGNPQFVERAKPEAVAKIRDRAAKAEADVARLTERLTTLRGTSQ